ncbi:14-3-3-like protein GF14 lambda [Juglans microcarpa x Juglans regia]|uniref:14-3-3-like protein GF14 lambda n=1 Tax=Juglans microcarpa x Juglans regia TaxID=2249226 RepID=UPI001B7F6DC7|nr:14-3-3-like protein GF14 lambda [Juglans microcarpa x Juglans regia]
MVKHQIPPTSASESKVFYLKMKGDYHRYLAEFKSENERKAAAKDTMLAYKAALYSSSYDYETPKGHGVAVGLRPGMGVQLAFNTAYHPQTDEQTEAVNKWVENYLRSYVSDRPKEWAQWVELAEWCYNSSQHASIKIFPFETLYGYASPQLRHYIKGTTRAEEVDLTLQN